MTSVAAIDHGFDGRARRAPRGRHLQAVQHARFAAGAGRRDGGPRRGARPLLEQLPRAGRPAGGDRGGDRGPAQVRRGHRLGALHLRHVRAAPRARARARASSSAPRRRSPTSPAGTRTRPHPDPDRREHGDPLRRAEPRVDHRRGPAGEARAQGGLQALGHGLPARAARVARAGPACARDHRRRLLDGGRPGEAARRSSSSSARTTRRSSSTTRTAPASSARRGAASRSTTACSARST